MKTILAIQPNGQRLGFAVMKGVSLKDFGVQHLGFSASLDERIQFKATPFVRMLIKTHRPDVLILPNRTKIRHMGRNRCIRAIQRVPRCRECKAICLSRKRVRRTFSGFVRPRRVSRETIMPLLTKWFPELQDFLPPPRRLWDSVAYRTPMFDAVALAVTFLHQHAQDKT